MIIIFNLSYDQHKEPSSPTPCFQRAPRPASTSTQGVRTEWTQNSVATQRSRNRVVQGLCAPLGTIPKNPPASRANSPENSAICFGPRKHLSTLRRELQPPHAVGVSSPSVSLPLTHVLSFGGNCSDVL